MGSVEWKETKTCGMECNGQEGEEQVEVEIMEWSRVEWNGTQ